MKTIKFLSLFFAMILILLSQNALATDLLNNLILTWQPTTSLSAFDKIDTRNLINSKLKIEKFTDNRSESDPKLIGQNNENEKKILPVKTDSDIAAFYQDGFTNTLKKIGFNLVSENPDYILTGSITHLFVNETNTYEGSLIIKLNLKHKDKIVWSDVINAKNTRFGHSYSKENYLEMFSDLGIESLIKLLNNSDFEQALSNTKSKSHPLKNEKTAAVSTAKPNNQDTENFKLNWQPTTSLSSFDNLDYKKLTNIKIKIPAFKDLRSSTELNVIGENIEQKDSKIFIKTNSNIASFYQIAFTDTLKKLGFDIVNSHETYSLVGKITHLYLTENHTYEGSLILKLELMKDSKIIWNQVINVKKVRFGKSRSVENYNEVYSDLAIEALLQLLNKDSGFKDSVQTKMDKN